MGYLNHPHFSLFIPYSVCQVKDAGTITYTDFYLTITNPSDSILSIPIALPHKSPFGARLVSTNIFYTVAFGELLSIEPSMFSYTTTSAPITAVAVETNGPATIDREAGNHTVTYLATTPVHASLIQLQLTLSATPAAGIEFRYYGARANFRIRL